MTKNIKGGLQKEKKIKSVINRKSPTFRNNNRLPGLVNAWNMGMIPKYQEPFPNFGMKELNSCTCHLFLATRVESCPISFNSLWILHWGHAYLIFLSRWGENWPMKSCMSLNTPKTKLFLGEEGTFDWLEENWGHFSHFKSYTDCGYSMQMKNLVTIQWKGMCARFLARNF